MRTTITLAILQALAVQGVRIIQGNDDGWAELYARSLHDALSASGHDVVLSGPAENKSGSGPRDEPPTDRIEPCHFDSCPPNSGPFGHNATRPELNWVNSYPVTAMRYGIDTFGPQLWDGATPELAVSGPNVGRNPGGITQFFSGTINVAVYAAHTARIPAIAFSGKNNGFTPWDVYPVPKVSEVYAQLAANLTNTIIAAGKPYLPDDVYLNVNFPNVDDNCPDAASFKWVLTRINLGILSPRDVEWCGSNRLPAETNVYFQPGCYISVSIGDASRRETMHDLTKQQIVLDKLKSLLTCLP